MIKKQKTLLPGFDEIIVDPSEPTGVWDGPPLNIKKHYFDASKLPDAPKYQDVAENTHNYIVYIVSPTFEMFKRSVRALRMNEDLTVRETQHTSTIDCAFPRRKEGETHLAMWEKRLYNNFIVIDDATIELNGEIYKKEAK